MKTIFLIFALFLIFAHSSAQGNLQFNRVVLIAADTAVSFVSGTPEPTNVLVRSIVVPSGKVLKIESINCGYCGYSGSGLGYAIYLDSLPIVLYQSSVPNLPIWLPAGSYTIKYYQQNTTAPLTSTIVFTYHLSAIEFNIVP